MGNDAKQALRATIAGRKNFVLRCERMQRVMYRPPEADFERTCSPFQALFQTHTRSPSFHTRAFLKHASRRVCTHAQSVPDARARLSRRPVLQTRRSFQTCQFLPDASYSSRRVLTPPTPMRLPFGAQFTPTQQAPPDRSGAPPLTTAGVSPVDSTTTSWSSSSDYDHRPWVPHLRDSVSVDTCRPDALMRNARKRAQQRWSALLTRIAKHVRPALGDVLWDNFVAHAEVRAQSVDNCAPACVRPGAEPCRKPYDLER